MSPPTRCVENDDTFYDVHNVKTYVIAVANERLYILLRTNEKLHCGSKTTNVLLVYIDKYMYQYICDIIKWHLKLLLCGGIIYICCYVILWVYFSFSFFFVNVIYYGVDWHELYNATIKFEMRCVCFLCFFIVLFFILYVLIISLDFIYWWKLFFIYFLW